LPEVVPILTGLGGPSWRPPGADPPGGGRPARPGGGGRRRGPERLRGGRRSAVPRRHGGTREPDRWSVRRTDPPRRDRRAEDDAATERTSLALARSAAAGGGFGSGSGGRVTGRFSRRRSGRLSQPCRPSRRGGGGAVVAVVVVGTPDAAPLRPVRRRRYRRTCGQQRRPAPAARSVADGVATRHGGGGRDRNRAQLHAERGLDFPASSAVGPAVRRLQPGGRSLAVDQCWRRRAARRYRPVLPTRESGRYRRCLRHQLRGQLDVDLE
jgi:hypothetical protein